MIIDSDFKPAWWLPGPHLQTLWPSLVRCRPKLQKRDERLELPDGDFLDIAWVGHNSGPTILILHGLEGGIESHYAAGILAALNHAGYRPVLMHFRGCSGIPNRLPRSYHSGETGDLQWVIEHIEGITGKSIDAAIGFSLGGNVLLKWLGEQHQASALKTAVAISVPFQLNDCALRLQRGFSTLYRYYLLDKLRRSYKARLHLVPPENRVDVDSLRSFREFDDQVTAPLNGFRDVDHYYGDSSSRQYLKWIETPTLILHADDDPFMWRSTIPQAGELSPAVTLELCKGAGHVGFIEGSLPWKSHYWLESRVIRHLNQVLSFKSS
jgi:predicted alpha/beta-fold hydrolase